MSKFFKIVLVVLIIILTVGVVAANTNGFTDSNPYGWIPVFDELEEGDLITGFEFNTDVDIDFNRFMRFITSKGAYLDPFDLGVGTHFYIELVTTRSEHDSVGPKLIVKYNTLVEEDREYFLCVRPSSGAKYDRVIYSSKKGWVEKYKSGFNFDKHFSDAESTDSVYEIVSIKKPRVLACYVGGTLSEDVESN